MQNINIDSFKLVNLTELTDDEMQNIEGGLPLWVSILIAYVAGVNLGIALGSMG